MAGGADSSPGVGASASLNAYWTSGGRPSQVGQQPEALDHALHPAPQVHERRQGQGPGHRVFCSCVWPRTRRTPLMEARSPEWRSAYAKLDDAVNELHRLLERDTDGPGDQPSVPADYVLLGRMDGLRQRWRSIRWREPVPPQARVSAGLHHHRSRCLGSALTQPLMPRAPRRCPAPDCTELITSDRYCVEHTKANAWKGNTTGQGSTRATRAARDDCLRDAGYQCQLQHEAAPDTPTRHTTATALQLQDADAPSHRPRPPHSRLSLVSRHRDPTPSRTRPITPLTLR